jgi:hypothetical protein
VFGGEGDNVRLADDVHQDALGANHANAVEARNETEEEVGMTRMKINQRKDFLPVESRRALE